MSRPIYLNMSKDNGFGGQDSLGIDLPKEITFRVHDDFVEVLGDYEHFKKACKDILEWGEDKRKKLVIEVHKLKGFGYISHKKMMESINLLELAINSEGFKNKFLTFEFKNPVLNNKELTNLQMYNHIMSGKDQFHVKEDSDIDIFVTMFNDFYSNTIGYTYPSTYKTWINYKYLKKFEPARIAGHIFHEYLHNIGFSHDRNWNSTRWKTVPYMGGTMITEVAQTFYERENAVYLL